MARLETLTIDPPNLAVSVASLTGRDLRQPEMFVRCNFQPPPSAPTFIEIVMPGETDRIVTVAETERLSRVSQSIVLECAGNGRTLMSPTPEGTPWSLGGASPVKVEGIRLRDVVGALPPEVVDVVVTGADKGFVEPEGQISYQFSLDRLLADSDVPLLVTHIGGRPLTPRHGAPVRLIVPGHYAMKSVKWVRRIEGSTHPFKGHFVEKYRYYGDGEEPQGAPVGPMAVRSVITRPAGGQVVGKTVAVTGSAWSRTGIESVEVSVDEGETWVAAELLGPDQSPYGARSWRVDIELGRGSHTVMARACDTEGVRQPMSPRWNANGYANNVAHRVSFEVD